jgi:hypothetical protein
MVKNEESNCDIAMKKYLELFEKKKPKSNHQDFWCFAFLVIVLALFGIGSYIAMFGLGGI